MGSRAFVLRETPEYEAWWRRLGEARASHVVAQNPWPIEDEWMGTHPERFVLELDDPMIRVYRLRP
jgi:hypothetical protein